MILYFAGSEPKLHRDLLKKAGVQGILQSAYTLGYRKEPSQGEFKHFVLDSGGFVARIKGKAIALDDYVNYINKFNVKRAFNLDTNDVEETLRNQEELEKRTNAYIIPVYHFSDFINPIYRGLLDGYVKKYPYISVGGVAKAGLSVNQNMIFLKYVFNKTRDITKVHGLGMTNMKLNWDFPFYSVDSTSWTQSMRWGSSSKKIDKKVKFYNSREVHYTSRGFEEIKEYLKLEKKITELWKKRGVDWDNK